MENGNTNDDDIIIGCLRNLKWIIHENVENPTCQAAMDTAWEIPPKLNQPKWPAWPGRKYTVTDSEKADEAKAARAMIGCPNGFGIAYMLMQHKEEFDTNTINSVTIFATDPGQQCLAWSIGPPTSS